MPSDKGAKQLPPALQHLFLIPRADRILINKQHPVIVIRHDDIGTHINGEDGREEFSTLNEPYLAMYQSFDRSDNPHHKDKHDGHSVKYSGKTAYPQRRLILCGRGSFPIPMAVLLFVEINIFKRKY